MRESTQPRGTCPVAGQPGRPALRESAIPAVCTRLALLARRSIALSAVVALLAALAPLTAVEHWRDEYGLAVLWIYPTFSLPQAWAIAVMTYTQLRPDLVADDNRDAVAARRLRWSTLAALLVQQIPPRFSIHQIDFLELSA